MAVDKYLSFFFLKSTEKLTGLDKGRRQEIAQEFQRFISSSREEQKLDIRLYTCKGFYEGLDFLVWIISDSFDSCNKFIVEFDKRFTGLFSLPKIFHGFTRRSQYFKQERPQNFEFGPSPLKYMFVYPFVKTHDWYQLPADKRGEMMAEHRAIGSKFEKVFTNTVYSFGFGDHEFLLAFETDFPKDFAELLIALREMKARPYTKYDVPIIPCFNKPEAEIISSDIFSLP